MLPSQMLSYWVDFTMGLYPGCGADDYVSKHGYYSELIGPELRRGLQTVFGDLRMATGRGVRLGWNQ